MRRSVRRCLTSVGAVAVAVVAVGQGVVGQGVVSAAAQVIPLGISASGAKVTAYVPPGKPLYFGEKGAAVKSVQLRLAQLHYYPGPIDGAFGEDTLEAAWAFREVQGLRVTVSNEPEPITTAFLKALVHPRQPDQLVPNGGADRVEINQNIQVLVLYRNDEPVLIAHVSSGG